MDLVAVCSQLYLPQVSPPYSWTRGQQFIEQPHIVVLAPPRPNQKIWGWTLQGLHFSCMKQCGQSRSSESIIKRVLRKLSALSWLDGLLCGLFLVFIFFYLAAECFTSLPSCYTHWQLGAWPAFILIPSCCITKNKLDSPTQVCTSLLACSDSSAVIKCLFSLLWQTCGHMDRQTKLFAWLLLNNLSLWVWLLLWPLG